MLLAGIAKILFHFTNKVHPIVPECCLLICLGLILGGVVYSYKEKVNVLTGGVNLVIYIRSVCWALISKVYSHRIHSSLLFFLRLYLKLVTSCLVMPSSTMLAQY